MGDTITGGGNRRVVMERARRAHSITDERRQRFLDTLAATCNVCRAAAATGIKPAAYYKLRKRDAGFAQDWMDAIAIGYDRLEAALLAKALGTDGDWTPGPCDDEPDIKDVRFALLMLANRQRTLESGGRLTRRWQRVHVASEAETDAALLKQLRILAHKREGNS